MDEQVSDPKVSEALGELQQYLSDTIAPLVVADSIGLLLSLPPQVAAEEIHAWTTSQYRRLGASVPISDYLYHALRKLHLMGEFTLVPKDQLAAFLEGLKGIVMEYCPPEDRELLRDNIARLSEAHTSWSSPVPLLHRLDGAGQPLAADEAAVGGKEVGSASRRFAQLVERLGRIPLPTQAELAASPTSRNDLVSQLLTVAARNSSDGEEFRGYREQLHERGFEASMDEIFRALSRRLPDWVVPASEVGGTPTAVRVAGTAEAMQRMVTLEQDPREAAHRFQELVHTAIEQVNAGSLARAVTMFDLAGLILAEKKVDPAFVQTFREQAHETLDPHRLRKFAEETQVHPLLRHVLGFFPALAPESLLEALRHEEKRERRRLMLALLEVHGAPARALVLERLRASIASFGDKDSFFQRNLLYLLRRIPRPPATPLLDELEVTVRLSQAGHPLPLVKEAIANLGQLKDERAERALAARVGEFEAALLKPSSSAYDPKELLATLDRAVFALARFGSPTAWRVVVNHGLKRHPQLGDTGARLAALAGHDLSGDPEMVDRLVKALVAETPHKVFGFFVHRDAANVLHLIDALSTTPAPIVRNALADLVNRFSDQEIGQAAAKVLAGAGVQVQPEEPVAASLTGDLELFGLPTLLQNLSQSDANGVLTLVDPIGESVGSIVLEKGKFRGCKAGHLRDEEALFQLFERPTPGSFAFVHRRDAGAAADPHGKPPRELVPLFFEGMRRYDEFQQACALVPDYACLKPSGSKPTRPADETDSTLLHEVWNRASSGAAALQCEADIEADSYRVRRLLAHWVEEGSLEPR